MSAMVLRHNSPVRVLKSIGRILLILFAAVVLFFAGYIYSRGEWVKIASTEHLFRALIVPSAEQSFLRTLDASQLRPPKLESGAYVLEIYLPSGKTVRETIYIPFVNNKFAFDVPRPLSRIGMKESAKISGHVVSWNVTDRFLRSSARFIGVVSGSQMFGQVYNYENGFEEEIGFWRLAPVGKDKAGEPETK